MSPRVRVIRFARVTEPLAAPDGALVALIHVDERPAAAGAIVRTASGWSHRLAGGSASGLFSLGSRHDLERQIVLFHLGPLPAVMPDATRVQPEFTWIAEAI